MKMWEYRAGVNMQIRPYQSFEHLKSSPSLPHLRQPTSGLDSTTALNLLHTLRTLASGGRTIITSIHQPSSRLYQQMDKVWGRQCGTLAVISSGSLHGKHLCPHLTSLNPPPILYYSILSPQLQHLSSAPPSTLFNPFHPPPAAPSSRRGPHTVLRGRSCVPTLVRQTWPARTIW